MQDSLQFFEQMLTALMENKPLSVSALQMSLDYIQNPVHRRSFIQQLSSLRAKYEST